MNRTRQDFTYDVFLSHSSKDREFVLRLATDLKKAGQRVWLDQWHIQPGDSFVDAIDQAIREARFLIIVMSPDYFQSKWTQQEWNYALDRELDRGAISLIPLLYRDCDIPAILRTKQWIDFRDATQYQAVLSRFLDVLDSFAAGETNAFKHSDEPEPGERVEELDPSSVSDLRKTLQDAIEAFRARPEHSPPTTDSWQPVIGDLCFIIMPFSVESLNIVYEDFVKPTLEERCKLRSERGDDVFGSNVIMDDITRSIQKAGLIIADLTGRNANVFYEVGIAHALNKQVLLMTQSIDDVPFDLRHRRALVYEYSPRGCKKLEKDLYENVRDMLDHRDRI